MSSKFLPPILIIAMLFLAGSCSGGETTLPTLPGDQTGTTHGGVLSDDFLGTVVMEPGTYPAEDDIRNLPQYLEGEVLIVLHDGVIPDALYPTAKSLGLSLKEEIKLGWGTVYRMSIDSAEAVESMVSTLKTYPEVRFAEPNYIYYPCAMPYYPNDPLFEYPGDLDDDPWNHMYDQWGPNVLGASLVWPSGTGDPGVVVAVLDTGYRHTHEDLKNQYWINDDEIPDNDKDDDDNGYIDDWRGWDFDGEDNDPWDTYGHGTACSGVVAAEQDNGAGCTGIAPGCKVMALRCNLTGGGGYTTTVIQGVNYAYANGADVISMSFRSYSESDIMHEAFITAWDDGNGMLPVGGAGNENSSLDCWPASWPEVFKIGATCSFYQTGERRDVTRLKPPDFNWGSNWGPNLEIMAPGALYVTTHVSGDSEYYDGDSHGTFGGTSNATPCVAACAALLKSYRPELTAAGLRERLKETADDIHTPGRDDQAGWGRVNIWRAIFGSEPNEDMYDENGHMPIDSDYTWEYDNIFDISTSADYDFEDIFVVEAGVSGVFAVELDIITTSENLDIEIYDNPNLTGEPIASSYGPNDKDKPGEQINTTATVGSKYYIRVFSPEPYNYSNFRIRVKIEEFVWWMDWESIAPLSVFNSSSGVPLLKLELYTNLAISINRMLPYVSGDIPLTLVNNFRLYEDTNSSGALEDGEDNLAAIANTADYGVNQLAFEGLSGESTADTPLIYFIVADVGPTTLGYNVYFGAGLRTYKDIDIIEKAKLVDDPFPILSDLVLFGEDHDPPVWDTTVGIQDIYEGYQSVVLFWNNATDALSEPTGYNVYLDENDPPAIATANVIENIPHWDGGDYDHACQISPLENDKTWFFLVRAEDASGNEDDNLIWLEGTPSGVSDPENPQVIGEITLYGNAMEVWVHNNIAYVACGNAGLAIVDCNVPTEPTLLDTYTGGECRGVQYYDEQDYVYAAFENGLRIIDPDAPGGPELVGSYDASYTRDVYVDNDICYFGVWGNLIVLDVSNPSEPEYKGEADIGWFQNIYGLSARDGYVYCCTSSDGFKVIDATDPTSPEVVKTITLESFLFEIQLWGNYALVTHKWFNTLYIIDISDPPNAFEAGSLDFGSGQGGGVAVRDGQYVNVGNHPTTLHSVNWSDLDNIQVVGGCETDGADGLYFDGLYLYSAENIDGLKIIL